MSDLSHFAEVPLAHLADTVRAQYRADFAEAVAQGRARQLVLPYSILGSFIVPTLWLAIPHSRNRWMSYIRWPVIVFIVLFNVEFARHTSSPNMAYAYAIGLLAFWAIMSTLNIFVWNDAQRDAARVVRRLKKARASNPCNGHSDHELSLQLHDEGLRRRKHDETASSHISTDTRSSDEAEYEYVWQPFPENGSFLERLNWSLDITTNFRFVGWNWYTSAVPGPKIESLTHIPDGTPVDMASIPVVTKSGHSVCLTEPEFVWRRIRTMAIMYLILDFLAVFMTKDPYFILGPEYHHVLNENPHPWHLQHVPSWALRMYRQVFSLAGILSAISGVFNANDIAQYYLARYIFPTRGELWQYSSTFGSTIQIFDLGLAGWWGRWWHQTFRLQLSAPAKWLIKRGYLAKGSGAAALSMAVISFTQSGLLHAAGSLSSIHPTHLWSSPAFFMLQAVGIVIQQTITFAIKKYIPQKWRSHDLVRLMNFGTTLLWLHLTSDLFLHDLSRSGLWLLDPVPFSFLRMLGLGFPQDSWWRWDTHFVPKWYIGRHWWESGIAL